MNSASTSPRRKTIHRVPKTKGTTSGFTQIDNKLLKDPKLSDRARGLLVRMLSRQDDWTFYVKQLSESGRDTLHTTRGALKELKRLGYVKIVPLLNEKTKKREGSTYLVFEDPDMPEKQQVGKTACRKLPPTKNDSIKNEKERDPLPPSGDMDPIPDEKTGPDEESPNPRDHDEIKSNAPSDSPTPSGPPFSSISRRDRRSDRWHINRAPVPLGGRLEEFSTNRWCMALAGLLKIEFVSQPEARLMLEAIGKTIGVPEMLWVQLVHVRLHPEPWQAGWKALRDRLEKIGVPNEHGDSADQDDVQEAVGWLLVQERGDECLQSIQAEMLRARGIPIPAEEPKLMHMWALHWRAYLNTWENATTGAILKLHDSIFSTLYIRAGLYDFNPTEQTQSLSETRPTDNHSVSSESTVGFQGDDGLDEQDDLYEWAIKNHQIVDPKRKEITETAELLRRLYCEKIRGPLGITDFELPSAENDIELWEKVARACSEAGAKPADFIEAQFQTSDAKKMFPATQLFDSLAIANYRVYAQQIGCDTQVTKSAEEYLKEELRHAGELIQSLAGTGDFLNEKVLNILRSECYGVSHYLRCLLCNEDPVVMKRYREDAAKYLLTNPSTRTAIRKIGLPLNQILDPEDMAADHVLSVPT